MFDRVGALSLLTTLILIGGCACCDHEPIPLPDPPAYADLGADIVIVGNILTMDGRHPDATGLVIKDGVIVHVTSRDIALRYASSTTRLINVPHNGVALPGFIESHAHLRALGRSKRQLDLRGARSAAEAAAIVAEAAKSSTPGTWILGRGWNQEDWGGGDWPTRLLLDQAAPGLAVALSRVDGHALWVNSLALEAARIGKDTVDPAGGEILRDDAGEPTGILIDNAMAAIESLIAKTSTSDEVRGDFLRAQEEAFRYGITTFVDCGESPERLLDLSALYEEGAMKLRVYGMIEAPTAADLEATFARPAVPSLFGDRLAVRAIKLYADGALGSRGARLLEPYTDRPDHYGFPVADPSLVKVAVRGCLDNGYQLCVHAIGDRANRTVLEAIQEALDKTPVLGHRFRIEHAQCVDPLDIPKFRMNGVIASVQPCHATSDSGWVFDRLGVERAYAIAYPYRSLLEGGLHPALGTDAPVENLSPLENFYAAVVRRDAGGRLAEPFMPEQQMNRMEALLGMTRYGAEAIFAEDRRGLLAPGYQADVVILDRDIMTCHPDLIATTGVAATIVAGEVVWDRVSATMSR